jgi:predicted protein tyrosine phosphatase
MINKVMFVSRNAIENLSGDWSDLALISIIEPNAVGIGKINDKAFKRVIHSHFHDVVTGRVYDEPVVEMDAKHAMSMVSFLHQIENEIEGVLVNCRAGISRSAAVAKWICESRGLSFNKNYSQYNPHVYKLLLDAEASWKRSNA